MVRVVGRQGPGSRRPAKVHLRLGTAVGVLTITVMLYWVSFFLLHQHQHRSLHLHQLQDEPAAIGKVGAEKMQANVKLTARNSPGQNKNNKRTGRIKGKLTPSSTKRLPVALKTGNKKEDKVLSDAVTTPKTTDRVPTEDEIIFRELDVDDSVRVKIDKFVYDRPDLYTGKEQLLGMLLEMDLNVTAVGDETWKAAPTWDEIQAVHGNEPVIYGLETCKAYRDQVSAERRRVGVAGMFNTGTNLLAILLQHNCGIPERIAIEGRRRGHGMEWQVPWGKHTPEYIGRLHYKVHAKKQGINWERMVQEDIMVFSIVRHPYEWIMSMCRHGYTAKWDHTRFNCPNLYEGNTVDAHFGAGDSHHASIAHMWNDWNGAYFNATYPRLMVRFEDVIFYPKQLSRKICACVGGKFYPPKENDGIFHYVIDSAKVGPGHGPSKHRNGLVDAYIKYGRQRDFGPLSRKDLDFMGKTFDKNIMRALRWEGPP